MGQPLDNDLDVGAAVYAGKEVSVQVFNEASVLSPGSATGSFEVIGRLLSPLAREEVGTISCVGLNVRLFPQRRLFLFFSFFLFFFLVFWQIGNMLTF